MRAMIMLKPGCKYATEITGVMAEWANKEDRVTILTLFGSFPVNGGCTKYVMYLSSDVAFSLCKKFEKEGIADLTTDYIRGLIREERFNK